MEQRLTVWREYRARVNEMKRIIHTDRRARVDRMNIKDDWADLEAMEMEYLRFARETFLLWLSQTRRFVTG